MMTRAEIIKHDIESVCFHEAGHLIALNNLGGQGFIRMGDAIEPGDLMNRTALDGCVRVIQNPRDRESIRIVGLAGAVSELIRTEGLEEPDWLDELLVEDGLSDTDREAADGYTADTLQSTIDLLRKHWSEVEFAAHWEFQKLMDLVGVAK